MQVTCLQKVALHIHQVYLLIITHRELTQMTLLVICILLTVIITDVLENILEIQVEIILHPTIGSSTHMQDITMH